MKSKPLMIFFISVVLVLFLINIPSFYHAAKEAGWNILKNPEQPTMREAFSTAESTYRDNFNSKYLFIESNGGVCDVMGRYSCNEAIKCSDGSVVTLSKMSSEKKDIINQANRVVSLKNFCDGEGIEFLYVSFPCKEGYEAREGNLPNGLKSNIERRENSFQQVLKSEGVNIYDMRNMFSKEDTDVSPYFYTDHHWTPESGFYAYTLLARKLAKDYGYLLDEKSIDIHNYTVETVSNDFLGTIGKRTGEVFSGLDSILKIKPKWDTDITFIVDGEERKGTYEEVFFVEERIKGNRYKNAYYGYFTGDNYAFTVQKNKDAINSNVKVLIIEDSMSLVVKSYYSFMFGEVAAIDVRRCAIKDSIRVAEYIRKEKPDIVVCQYNEGVLEMDANYGNAYDFGL